MRAMIGALVSVRTAMMLTAEEPKVASTIM